MQTCARHASSSDKIQLRSVTRIVPAPRNVSRDTTGWMEAAIAVESPPSRAEGEPIGINRRIIPDRS